MPTTCGMPSLEKGTSVVPMSQSNVSCPGTEKGELTKLVGRIDTE